MDYAGYGDKVKPVRKIVAGEEYVHDVQLLADATAKAIAQLYRNAEESSTRIVSWTVTYEPAPGSPYGEHDLTVRATQVRRKPLRLNAAQMEEEIMGLLSQPRED